MSRTVPKNPTNNLGNVTTIHSEKADTAAPTPIDKVKTVEKTPQNEKDDQLIEKTVNNYKFYISGSTGVIKKVYLIPYRSFVLVEDLFDSPISLSGVHYNIIGTDAYIEINGYQDSKKLITKKISVNADYLLTCSITFYSDFVDQRRLSFHVKKSPDQDKSRYQEFVYKKEYVTTRIPLHKVTAPLKLSQLRFFSSREVFDCFALIANNDLQVEIARENNDSYDVSIAQSLPETTYTIYIGPQKQKLLEKYGIPEIIHYGFFHPISVILMHFLNFAHAMTRNWGFSIILITILINILMLPLTKKSTQSMREMQKVQGDVEKLRAKYKDNPQKLNQEIMDLYKIHKINPLSGCLPWLLQIPVFFGFFQVLNRFIEINGASFLWINDLSLPDRFFKLPVVLPFGLGEYFNLLPILMTVVMFLQQKVTMTQTNSSQAEQQKMMMIVLPIVMGFVFYKFSSALVLYWLTNSLMMFAYQYSVLKKK